MSQNWQFMWCNNNNNKNTINFIFNIKTENRKQQKISNRTKSQFTIQCTILINFLAFQQHKHLIQFCGGGTILQRDDDFTSNRRFFHHKQHTKFNRISYLAVLFLYLIFWKFILIIWLIIAEFKNKKKDFQILNHSR